MYNKLNNHLNKIQKNEIQEIVPLMLSFSAANAIIGAIKLYKQYFNKYALRCKNLPEKEKNICIIFSKINSLKLKIKKLQESLSKCKLAKNPEKCNKKLKDKIYNEQIVLKLLIKRYNKLKQK
jgi:vacuolar-type H+-ATPase subunit I/STV1